MPASFFRNFPPCKGDEPYLYLCFHQADARSVKPILDELTKRRCRIWYHIGSASNTNERNKNIAYEKNAALMVFWLSACAAGDESMKSALGYYQTTGRPIICIDNQSNAAQSGFTLILNHNAQIIDCEPGLSAEALVSKIMRTEGFTQQLIAENDHERQLFLRKRKSRRVALAILFAALAVLGCAIVYAQSNNWFLPEVVITDSVTINDPVIKRAARHALSPDGNVPLTQENLALITTLRIDAAPSSFNELSLFPALTRLEIPQSCVNQAAALLDSAPYSIVVYPEDVS